jgi:hypothetical protein
MGAGAVHTWSVEKGKLVAYANGRRFGAREPSHRDGFTGGAATDVQRDAKGRITGCVLGSGRVRHLRFTRERRHAEAQPAREVATRHPAGCQPLVAMGEFLPLTREI